VILTFFKYKNQQSSPKARSSRDLLWAMCRHYKQTLMKTVLGTAVKLLMLWGVSAPVTHIIFYCRTYFYIHLHLII